MFFTQRFLKFVTKTVENWPNLKSRVSAKLQDRHFIPKIIFIVCSECENHGKNDKRDFSVCEEGKKSYEQISCFK